jgi:hypothetical protein
LLLLVLAGTLFWSFNCCYLCHEILKVSRASKMFYGKQGEETVTESQKTESRGKFTIENFSFGRFLLKSQISASCTLPYLCPFCRDVVFWFTDKSPGTTIVPAPNRCLVNRYLLNEWVDRWMNLTEELDCCSKHQNVLYHGYL